LGRAAADLHDKLILGVPLTHSDWMLKSGMAWGEPGVRHMLDACKACGWSRIYWRALDGGRALYKSRLVRAQGQWDLDNGMNPQTEEEKKFVQRVSTLTPQQAHEISQKFASLDYEHFDSLAAAVRYGHQIGLQIHAWASVNEDDHFWGMDSEFSKKHPEFRWVRRDGRPYHSQMSFAYPEVRDYKLGILNELLQGYDIDGLFLDWLRTGDVRDNPQTDSKGVANYGYELPSLRTFKDRFGIDAHDVDNGDERWVRTRAEPRTVFMRSVRELVLKHRRRLPVAVLVAHPWCYRGLNDPIDGNLRGLLLDVGAWAKEGLMDAAVPGGYYRPGGSPSSAYRALKEETGGRVDVWYYGWVPSSAAQFDQDFKAAKDLGAKQMLLWEADYIDDRPDAAQLKAHMHSRTAG
jgi:8-oxo-dGTP pyrophosphatase MutT (NUDIX family)